MGKNRQFDRSRLRIKPLAERTHDLDQDAIKPLEPFEGDVPGGIAEAAKGIIGAREKGSEVIMMMGGHVVRSGTQRYIIDLLDRGYLTCLSMNGS